MSTRVLSWVFRSAPVTRSAELLCLLAIAEHAHDDGGGAFPSVRTIASMARMSERNVRYTLRRLQAVGLLVIEPHEGKPSTYRILMTPATVAGVSTPARVAAPPRQGLQPHPGNRAPDPCKPAHEPLQQLLPPNRKEPTEEPTAPTPLDSDEVRPPARDEATAEAVRAMHNRGISNPDELLALATPDKILATCRWWDRQKNVGPGLLAMKIRQGGVREVTDRGVTAAPPGPDSAVCSHADDHNARQWREFLAKLADSSLAGLLAGTHPHEVNTATGVLRLGAHPQKATWLRQRFVNGTATDIAASAGCHTLEIEPCSACRDDDALVQAFKDTFDAVELDEAEYHELIDGVDPEETTT